MAQLKKDPESYFTTDKIGYMPKITGVDERLGSKVGFHEYELCLLRTYWNTEKYFKQNPTIDEVDAVNHLYSLKTDILRYCLPHGLDWKSLMVNKSGYLIVQPGYRFALYFRLMANNLFILDETLVSRFLDFHLVNAVLKFKQSRTNAPKLIDDALISFLQEIDYFVIHSLQHEMPCSRAEIILRTTEWVRQRMDHLSEKLLVKYHEYEFNSESGSERHPYEQINQTVLQTGCPNHLVNTYFSLLKAPNPEIKGIIPFVSEDKVKYIVKKWFCIGDETISDYNPIVTLTRPQLLFFLYQFKTYFCKSRKKGTVENENMIRLAFDEFPELFEGITFKSQLDNFKRDASNGKHRSLDFRGFPDLRKSQEELKKH